MVKGYKEIKKVTWEQVFANWKTNEGADPEWQRFAIEEKGWGSWEEWRLNRSKMLGLPERDWTIFEIDNPNLLIPKIKLGPFPGWQKNYPESEWLDHTFKDLVKDKMVSLGNNKKIKSCIDNFPELTQFIGLIIEEEVYMYEGHHRCVALTYRLQKGKPLKFKNNPTIAITRFDPYERELLINFTKQGSENPNRKNSFTQ